MFDDKQPEDIFEGSDKAPAPTNLPVDDQRIAPAPSLTSPTPTVTGAAAMGSAPMQEEGHPLVSAKVVLVAIIILGVIGATIAISYSFMSQPQTVVPTSVIDTLDDEDEDDTQALIDDEEGKGDQDDAVGLPETEPAVMAIDSDGDGLANDEELELGTSINNPDSDSDGLGDREEVQVYKTNPLNPDTDSDTYLDGAEVQGGYNPNGEGKLLQVPALVELATYQWLSQGFWFKYPATYYIIDLSVNSLRVSPSRVLPDGDVPLIRLEMYVDGQTIDSIINEDLDLSKGERTEVVKNGQRLTKVVSDDAFGGTLVVYLSAEEGGVLVLTHWDNAEHAAIADDILSSISLWSDTSSQSVSETL